MRRLLGILIALELALGSVMLFVPRFAHRPTAAKAPAPAQQTTVAVSKAAPVKPAPAKPPSEKSAESVGLTTTAAAATLQSEAPAEQAKPVPVLTQQVTRRDVPIYLDGLGTALASALVTVRAQVDGTLQEVRFKEGEDVHVGDVLAKIDPRTYQAALDQANAKKHQDMANLANARLDLARYEKLSANAYSSAQQTDTAKAQVAQLEAQVAGDQAQIDNARTQLSYTTITAPVDGRTGIRQVDAGNILHAADATGIVVITTIKPISVIFTLPQQLLPQVAAAMRAGPAEVLALPQGDDKHVLDRGTLAVLDNQVDQSTGTIKLKATFPNADLLIWPGAFLTARLKVDVKHNATVVPPVAVQRGPDGAFVYVVGADMTATRREVTIGHEDQVAAIVDEGLAPGETVVTDGASRLTDHAKVIVSKPPTPGRPAGAQPRGARP